MNARLMHVIKKFASPPVACSSSEWEDAELLRRFLATRDATAFAEITKRHGPLIWAVCRQLLPNHADAEDAFQATFLAFLQAAKSIRVTNNLSGWLYGVAVRIATKIRRSDARRHQREAFIASPDSSPVLSDTSWIQFHGILHEEVQRLPQTLRVAFILCELQGVEASIAAKQLKCTPGTLAVRLSRARQRLLDRLAKRDIAPAVAIGLMAIHATTTTAEVPAPLLLLLNTFPDAATHELPAFPLKLAKEVFPVFTPLTKIAIAAVLSLSLSTAGISVALIPAGGTTPDEPTTKKLLPQAAKRVPAENHVVTGKVIQDADGTPVAGAEVRLLFNETTKVPRPTTLTTTSERGEFSFQNVTPGKYVVMAFAGELTSRTRMMEGLRVNVPAKATDEPVVLRMKPGVSLKVRVVSEATGKPIPNAKVGFVWTDLDPDRTTNALGQVEYRTLTKESWTVYAGAKGYAKAVQTIVLQSDEPAMIEFKLRPGAAIMGVVRDEAGQPIPGVGINTYRNTISPGIPDNYFETDAEGRYHFDYLHVDEELTVSCSKVDFVRIEKLLTLIPGEPAPKRVDFILKPRPHGGSVQGTVADSQGKPIVGATVINRGSSTDEERRTQADAEGKYRLDQLYATQSGHSLVVKANGYAPQNVKFEPGPLAKPTICDIKLEPGHRIRGRVVDSAGLPVQNVHVNANDHNSYSYLDESYVQTDHEGRFQFSSLSATPSFTFQREGFTTIASRTLAVDGMNEIVIPMQAEGVIVGKVIDSVSKKPIPYFTISMIDSPDPRDGEPQNSTGLSMEVGGIWNSSAGQFRVEELTAGAPIQVVVSAEGYRRCVIRRVIATIAKDAKPTEFLLAPIDPKRLTTIRGKLMNYEGKPVRGAQLRLIVADKRPADRTAHPYDLSTIQAGYLASFAVVERLMIGTTAADGSFEFRHVDKDREIELVYWGKGIPVGRIDRLEKKSEDELGSVTIKALASAKVTVKIDLKAFVGFSMISLSDQERSFNVTRNEDGKTFVFDDLPPGSYSLDVLGPSKPFPGDTPDPRQGERLTSNYLARKSLVLKGGQHETVVLDAKDVLP